MVGREGARTNAGSFPGSKFGAAPVAREKKRSEAYPDYVPWVKGEGIQALNVLLAVAETGSMAKAAKQLAISQPVVSRRLPTWKHHSGCAYSIAAPQSVEPTLYGRALLKRSLTVFDDLRRVPRDRVFRPTLRLANCGIGVTEPQAALVAAIIKAACRGKHPR